MKFPCHKNLAWAILIAGGERHQFLADRYYFDQLPRPSHAGCHVALFATRREARLAASGSIYGRTVVRVEVAVKAAKP